MTLKKFLKKAGRTVAKVGGGAVTGLLMGGPAGAIAGGLLGGTRKGGSNLKKDLGGGLMAGAVVGVVAGSGLMGKTIVPKAKSLFGSAKTLLGTASSALNAGKAAPLSGGMTSLEDERDAYLANQAGRGGGILDSAAGLLTTLQGTNVGALMESSVTGVPYETLAGGAVADKPPPVWTTRKVLLAGAGVISVGTLIYLATRK